MRRCWQNWMPVLPGLDIPGSSFRRADVGLILMVRGEQHDFATEHAAAELGNRHFDGLDATHAAIVRIHASQIIDVTNHDIGGGSCRLRGDQLCQCHGEGDRQ
jgi:hypothetical protein